MKRFGWWILAVFGLGIIALLTIHWWSGSTVTHTAGPEVVRFGKVEQRTFSQVVHFFGKAESTRAVEVTVLNNGRILSVGARDGEKVSAGQELFTLGGPELSPVVTDTQTSLKAARVHLASAEKSVALVRDAVNRHLMEQIELTAEIAEATRAQTEVATLESRWAVLNATIHLKSPISGIFTKRTVNPGQDVRAGQTLARIVPENKVRVVASLFPPDRVELSGAVARIHRTEGAICSGTVVRVLPERTPTGAQTIWIEGNDISTGLAPGTPVTGKLTLQSKSMAAVPDTAIVRDETGQTTVFVRGKSGIEGRSVKIGLTRGGWVEILSGVSPGEEIAIEGAYELYHRDFSHTFKVAD